MCLLKIILKRKVISMSNKILNEYYKEYLKKVSKDNIQKYNEEKKKQNQLIRNEIKNEKK